MGKGIQAFLVLFLVIGVFATVFISMNQQDPRSRASTEHINPYQSSAPAGQSTETFEIKNVQINLSSQSTRVTWQTSAPATSYLEYGTNRDQLTDKTAPEATPQLSHTAAFPITPGVRYYFRVRATGNAGGEAISTIYNFKP